jgi:serine/threonine-protein kinase RsbT
MKLLQKKTQLITAASELMTNMIKYANGGEVEIQASNMGRKKIVVVFTDKGPGIPDID